MKNQIWVKCSKMKEEELTQLLKGFDVKLSGNDAFPVCIDTKLKIARRITSASCCGAYVSCGGKILKEDEIENLM